MLTNDNRNMVDLVHATVEGEKESPPPLPN